MTGLRGDFFFVLVFFRFFFLCFFFLVFDEMCGRLFVDTYVRACHLRAGVRMVVHVPMRDMMTSLFSLCR